MKAGILTLLPVLSQLVPWQYIFINLSLLQLLKLWSMRSILYLIAVILVIGWLLGFFVYSAGGLIHILIVLAVVSLLLGLIRST
jgi:hypothetical protein